MTHIREGRVENSKNLEPETEQNEMKFGARREDKTQN